MEASPSKVVVLGVGNVLMCDEGVGCHAVAAFEQEYAVPAAVRCVDGGTSTQELLGDLEDLDLLVVLDAVAAGRAPAEVIRLEGEAVPSAFTTKLSPHQIGIADLLATLKFIGREPKRVVLFGVEPARLELDLALSPTVAARVPELCRMVAEVLDRAGLPTAKRAAA